MISSVPGNSVAPCVDTVFHVLFRYDTLTGQRTLCSKTSALESFKKCNLICMGVFSKSVRTFLCSGFLVAGMHIYESLQCAIDRQRPL